MSTTIENRIVQMEFDNQQFEREVKTSLSTLDKLKEALNFKNVENNVNLTGITTAVTTVSQSFSAFEQVAIGALRRIGDQAITTGENFIKSLSVDNISAGWAKFGEKTGSVATLVAQGFDIETVNEQMERLNWYTDETSYNFTDMVSNISKFTASGQDLEGSVTAMEGIANWAALSGQNATTASRAMYQLSQAMGKGALRYDDWKSIQNASMDTQEFRKQALAAAEAVGTVRKELDGTYTTINDGEDSGNFTMQEMFTSDALTKKQWITSDVMMKTFKQYAAAIDDIYEYAEEKGITASEAMGELGDSIDEFGLKAFKAAQEARTWGDVVDSVKDAVSTGWMNTFELIFGDADKATQVWTWWANELYDVFAEGGNFRNEVLGIWSEGKGYNDWVWAVANSWYALTDTLGAVRDGIAAAFGFNDEASMLARHLIQITKAFRTWSEEIAPTERQLATLKNVTRQIAGVLKRVISIIGAGISAAFRTFKAVATQVKDAFLEIIPDDAVDQINNFLDTILEMIRNFNLSEDSLDKIKRAFRGLFAVVNILNRAFEAFIDVFGEDIMNIAKDLADKFLSLAAAIGDFLVGVDDSTEKGDTFHTVFTKIRDTIVDVVDKLKNAFNTVKTTVTDFIDKLSATPEFQTFVDNLTKLKDTIVEAATTFGGSALSTIGSWFDSLGESGVNMDVVVNGLAGILGKLNEFFDLIESSDISSIGTFFSDLFADLDPSESVTGFIEAIKKTITTAFSDEGVIGTAQNQASSLLGTVVEAIKKAFEDQFGEITVFDILEAINMVALLRIALALGNFFGSIADTMENASKIPKSIVGVLNALKTTILSYQAQINAGTLLKMAGAIALLAVAIGALSFIPAPQLDTAVVAIAAILGMLTLLTNAIGKMLAIQSGMDAMDIFAQQLGKGLRSLAKSLGMAAKIAAFGGAILSIAIGLGLIAAAIYALYRVFSSEGFDGNAFSNSIGVMVGAFVLIGGAVAAIGAIQPINAKKMASFGLAFLEISGSMLLIAFACKLLAGIQSDMEQAIVALASLSFIVGLMATIGGSNLVKARNLEALGPTFIKMSAGLILMAAALRIVASVPGEQAKAAANAINLTVATLVVAMAVVSKANLESAANALLTAAVIIVAVGAALAAVAASGATWDNVWQMLVGLAGALIIFLAAAAVSSLAPVSAGLIVLSNALLALGAAIALGGVGILAFAAGIKLLGDNSAAVPGIMVNIANGIIQFGQVIKEDLAALGAFVLAMLAIAVAAAAVTGAVVAVIWGMSKLLSLIGPFFATVGQQIPIGGMAIVAGIAVLIAGILTFLGTQISDFVSSAIKLLIIAINSISLAILENGEAIGVALGNLVAALGALLLSAIGGFLEGILGPLFPNWASNVSSMLEESFGSGSELHSTIQSNNEALLGEVEDGFSQIAPTAQEAVDSGGSVDFTNIYNNDSMTPDAEGFGASAGGSFVDSFNKTVENANTPEVAKGLSADTAKAEQRAAAKSLAEEFNSEYASTVESAEPPDAWQGNRPVARQKATTEATEEGEVYTITLGDKVEEGMGPVGNTVETGLREIDTETVATDTGTDFMSYLSQSMGDNSFMATDSAESVNFDIQSVLNDPSGFSSIFSSNMDGASGGILGSIPGLTGAAGEANSGILGTLGDTIGFSSTSAENMDAYTSEIQNSEPEATAAAASLSDATSAALGDSYNTAFEAGSNVSTGFGAGMYSKQSAVSDAAGYISDNAANRFESGSTNSYNAGATLSTKFAEGMTSKRMQILSNATSIIRNLTTVLNAASRSSTLQGATFVMSYVKGMSSMSAQPVNSAKVILTSTVNVLYSGGTNARYAGVSLISYFAQGISSAVSYPVSAATTVVSKVSTTLDNMYKVGYKAGKEFDEGLAKGMYDYMYKVLERAAEVAEKAAKAAKDKLKIQSPSKVAAEIGRYFDLGFANGLSQNGNIVEKASSQVSEATIDAFSTVASRIMDILNGTLDLDPTIRPVLDLSDIQNRTAQLNGMLSGSYSYAASAFSGIGGLSTTDQILGGLGTIAAKLNDTRPMPTINVTVNAGNVDDPEELAEIISDRIQFKYAQLGASIGG